jgi:DNA uptake protein ComE-like DNA-binding protein
MSVKAILFCFAFAGLANAKEATPPAPATNVASDGVEKTQLTGSPKSQLAFVGRLNVNTASRDQLLRVPGLDGSLVEAILEARVESPIADLDEVAGLPDQARVHLKLDGDSNFTRILKNPLQTLASR